MKTRIKKYVVLAVAVCGLVGSKAWAVTGHIDGTVTVTPNVTVSLSLSPTTYAFGQLDVNTSSVTGTALTLANTGNVNARITKQIPSDTGLWVADSSSVTANHYILSVATSTFAPNPDESEFSNSLTVHRFGKAVSNTGVDSPVQGLAGTGANVDLDALGGSAPSAKLWFRLQMPTNTTSAAAQEIVVRFTGTSL